MQEMTIVSERIETETKLMEVQVSQAIAAIHDDKSCDIATKLACECADWIDKIDKEFDESLKAAKLTVDNLNKQVKGYQAPYRTWKEQLNQAIGEWRWKLRKKIEDDNKKAIEDAEKEAKAKAEREALKLEKKGDVETAALVRSEPPIIAPILQEIPKNKNVVDKTTWVVDLFESPADRWKLIKHLVEGGPVNMGAITVNLSYLKNLAKLRHEEMKKWPGMRVRPVFSSDTRRDSRAG